MAKRTRKSDPEEIARRKLADAQAKLQLSQERRSRAVTRGEQEIEAVRDRASLRTEKATKDVERRAAKVARTEASLLKVRERRLAKSQRKTIVVSTHTAPSRSDVPTAVANPIVTEPLSPAAVADELAILASSAVQQPEVDSGELVTAISADQIDALVGAESRALETLRTQFADQGATFTEWLLASGISRKTFLRARKALVDRGLVQRAGSGPGARYSPTA